MFRSLANISVCLAAVFQIAKIVYNVHVIVKSVKYCKRHQLRRVSTLLLFIGIFLEKN